MLDSPFVFALLGNIVVWLWILTVIIISSSMKRRLLRYLDFITATTVGIVLWIIFFGFLPKITTTWNLLGTSLGVWIVFGIFLFYILELFLHWHHCKDLSNVGNKHKQHWHENGILMFGGTLLHNFFHGIVLFSAFSVNLYFGLATTLAVGLHAIPQNLVNYIMNHNAKKYVYIASFGGVLWALFTYPFGDFLIQNKFIILAIIAGGLLYTSLADILPEFKHKGTIKQKFLYLFCILVGIGIFFSFEFLGHLT